MLNKAINVGQLDLYEQAVNKLLAIQEEGQEPEGRATRILAGYHVSGVLRGFPVDDLVAVVFPTTFLAGWDSYELLDLNEIIMLSGGYRDRAALTAGLMLARAAVEKNPDERYLVVSEILSRLLKNESVDSLVLEISKMPYFRVVQGGGERGAEGFDETLEAMMLPSIDDGMTMRLGKTAVLVGVLAVTGCSKSKDDDDKPREPISLVTPTPSEAKVLPLDGVKWTSFMTIPWEKRCEGIEEVVQAFQKNNLPGFLVSPLPRENFPACEIIPSDPDTSREQYEYSFRLSKDGKNFDMKLQVSAGPELYRGNTLVSLWWKNGNSAVLVGNNAELNSAHINFQHFDKTLDAWYLKDDVEASIFGRPYSQYLDEIKSTFGENGGFIWRNPNVKMRLTMDQRIRGKGTAEIIEAEDGAFSAELPPVFGCKDINCLQGSMIRFQVLGTTFFMDRVVGEQAGGTTLLSTWRYSLKSWPLTFE